MGKEVSTRIRDQASNIQSLKGGPHILKTSKLRSVVGTVVWFSEEQGFGFIKVEGSDEEVFVDASAIKEADKSLVQGQRVMLDVEAVPESRYDIVDEARRMRERSKRLDTIDRIVFDVEGLNDTDVFPAFTPLFLTQTIGPYLGAIADLQSVINEVHNIKNDVTLVSIQQRSPVTVDLKGASEAITLIMDTIIPWRRKHQEKLSRLAIEEKRTEIKNKQADILEKETRIQKEKAEVIKTQGEAEAIQLENEQVRLELERTKVRLAKEIMAEIAPHISDSERLSYFVKLLPALDVMLRSEIQIHPEPR